MKLKWKRIVLGLATVSITGVAYAQARSTPSTLPEGKQSNTALQNQVKALDQTVSTVQVQLQQAKQMYSTSVAHLQVLQTQEVQLQKQVLIRQEELRQEAQAQAVQARSRASGGDDEGDDHGQDD